jgi:hypothetical protein
MQRKLTFALALAAALVAAALAAGAASAGQPTTQVLNPAPPPEYSCSSNGGGTICRAASLNVPYGPSDNDIWCGSGPTAFDTFDQGFVSERKTRWYDANGNWTKREIRQSWDSYWSNPLSGKIVPYTQHDVIKDVLAVPGDPTSSTQTTTGENIYRDGSGTGKPILFSTGRQVWNFDQSELISSTPHNAFVEAFVFGDFTVFDSICAALA